jgi:predicted PurR-regulated permease PerM
VLATLAAALALAVLWLAGRALLLLCLAVLVGVIFDGVARPLAKLTGLGHRWCVLIAFLVVLGVVAGLGWLTAPHMIAEARAVATTMTQAWRELSRQIGATELGRRLLASLQGQDGSGGVMSGIAWRVWDAASVTINGVFQGLIVTMAGLYLAVDPGLYLRGLLHLVPERHRGRTGEIVLDLTHILRRWFLGLLAAIAAIGVVSGVGYGLIGLPQPLMLGFIAGLAELVPYLGPVLGAVPALLLASTMDLQHVLYVLGVYLAIHTFEGNFVLPLITRWSVYLPPALTLSMELVLGLLGGIPGMLVSVPLTAVLMVAIRDAYVEDTLGDHTA